MGDAARAQELGILETQVKHNKAARGQRPEVADCVSWSVGGERPVTLGSGHRAVSARTMLRQREFDVGLPSSRRVVESGCARPLL